MPRLFRALGAIIAAVGLWAATPAEAVTASPPIDLSTTAWTDLGAGPLRLSMVGLPGGVYQVADAAPADVTTIIGQPIPAAGGGVIDVQTTSHVWARAAVPNARVVVTPISSAGGGSGAVQAFPSASSTGGASSFSEIVPANTTGVSVKASAGTLYYLNLANIGSTVLWVKLYDTATAPTCGSGTPVRRLMLPIASTAANGAGNNIDFGPVGVAFSSGIGMCVTAGIADADTTSPTANVATVGISYK